MIEYYCSLSDRVITNAHECKVCLESDKDGSCKHLKTKEIELPMLVTKKDILSWLAYWGMQQCSTHTPFEFETVLKLAEKQLAPKFEKAKWGSISVTRSELYNLVNPLQHIPQLRKWNLTKKEYDKGIDPDSPQRDSFVGVSGYDAYVDYNENDFIDLDALVRNIVISIEQDCIKKGYTK